jgi:hypothetical protein
VKVADVTVEAGAVSVAAKGLETGVGMRVGVLAAGAGVKSWKVGLGGGAGAARVQPAASRNMPSSQGLAQFIEVLPVSTGTWSGSLYTRLSGDFRAADTALGAEYELENCKAAEF